MDKQEIQTVLALIDSYWDTVEIDVDTSNRIVANARKLCIAHQRMIDELASKDLEIKRLRETLEKVNDTHLILILT